MKNLRQQIICTVNIIMLLSFIAQHTSASPGGTRDSMHKLSDQIVNKLIDQLKESSFDRRREGTSFLHADLEDTTLGKPGHVAVNPRMSSLQAWYRPPIPEERTLNHHLTLFHNRLARVQQSKFIEGQRVSGFGGVLDVASPRASVMVSASVFDRVGRIVGSNLNKLIESAEDPEKILDQVVNEMQDDLVGLKKEFNTYVGKLKQAEDKYSQQAGEIEMWMRRAELAMSKNDEELAREALKRKKAAEEVAENSKVEVDNTKKAIDQLAANVKLIEQKVEEAKAKKSTLKARAATAQSNKQVVEMIQGLDTGSNSLAAFEQIEEKVLALEAETEVVAQLKAPKKDVMDKFDALEAGSTVDDELEKLKAKMLPEKSSNTKGSPPE